MYTAGAKHVVDWLSQSELRHLYTCQLPHTAAGRTVWAYSFFELKLIPFAQDRRSRHIYELDIEFHLFNNTTHALVLVLDLEQKNNLDKTIGYFSRLKACLALLRAKVLGLGG